MAGRLLQNAEAHVGLATKGFEDDPAVALQLSDDAARKASAALLAVQGLRSTTRGERIAVIDAIKAQLNRIEATAGIEPAYRALQALASR